MNEQNFKSNGDMVRHYFLELLSDGEAHSNAEILAYVNEKANFAGIGGERLTDETVRCAVWYRLLHGIASYVQTRRGFYQMLPRFAGDSWQGCEIRPDFIARNAKTGFTEYVFETERGALHVPLNAFFGTDAEAESEGYVSYFTPVSGLRVFAKGKIRAGRAKAQLAIVGNGIPELLEQLAPEPGMTKERLFAALNTLTDGGDPGYLYDELVALGSLVFLATEAAVDRAWADCHIPA